MILSKTSDNKAAGLEVRKWGPFLEFFLFYFGTLNHLPQLKLISRDCLSWRCVSQVFLRNSYMSVDGNIKLTHLIRSDLQQVQNGSGSSAADLTYNI